MTTLVERTNAHPLLTRSAAALILTALAHQSIRTQRPANPPFLQSGEDS